MRPILNVLGFGFALIILLNGSCKTTDSRAKTDTTDRFTLCTDFQERAPANLAILPVGGGDVMDAKTCAMFRDSLYDLFLNKGYAPLSPAFTDKSLRDIGLFHTPVRAQSDWNTSPFTDAFTEYCDGLALISVDRYRESGQPDRFGIEIWGRVGIFDARSMDLLFEHYTRQILHPTDPGGGRERFILKALEEFSVLLLGPLPQKGTGRNP